MIFFEWRMWNGSWNLTDRLAHHLLGSKSTTDFKLASYLQVTAKSKFGFSAHDSVRIGACALGIWLSSIWCSFYLSLGESQLSIGPCTPKPFFWWYIHPCKKPIRQRLNRGSIVLYYLVEDKAMKKEIFQRGHAYGANSKEGIWDEQHIRNLDFVVAFCRAIANTPASRCVGVLIEHIKS